VNIQRIEVTDKAGIDDHSFRETKSLLEEPGLNDEILVKKDTNYERFHGITFSKII
jgi:hypothetical protein